MILPCGIQIRFQEMEPASVGAICHIEHNHNIMHETTYKGEIQIMEHFNEIIITIAILHAGFIQSHRERESNRHIEITINQKMSL